MITGNKNESINHSLTSIRPSDLANITSEQMLKPRSNDVIDEAPGPQNGVYEKGQGIANAITTSIVTCSKTKIYPEGGSND